MFPLFFLFSVVNVTLCLCCVPVISWCVTHFLIMRCSTLLCFSPRSAKDRDAEGAGEAGEADGAGVRGASRERSQSCERSPPQNPPGQQNYR